MIAHLRGRLAWVGMDQAVVDVGGVGYQVWVPSSTRVRLPQAGDDVLLHTSMQVREDSMTLYGFSDTGEKQLFEALLAVSGIGPKVALSILSGTTPDLFCRAIALEDTAALTRLPGVGKKLAQRLVLELKEKLAALPPGAGAPPSMGLPAAAALAGSPPPATAWDEAIEALTALGYARAEAAAAMAAVRPDVSPEAASAEWVRAALRHLGRVRHER